MFAQCFPHFVGVHSGVLRLVLGGLDDGQELEVHPGVGRGEGEGEEGPGVIALYPGPGDRVHRVGSPQTHRLDWLARGEGSRPEEDQGLAVSVRTLWEDQELWPTCGRDILILSCGDWGEG